MKRYLNREGTSHGMFFYEIREFSKLYWMAAERFLKKTKWNYKSENALKIFS